MKKKILIAVAVVAVLAVVVSTSLKKAGGGRGIKVYMEDVAKRQRLTATVEASGEVEPRVEVNISSQVPGQIVELRVEEGDRVRNAQILVQLDPGRYRSEVRRLEAFLRMAGVNVEKERISLANADISLRRIETLHRQRIVSDDQLDQAKLAVDSGRVGLQSREEEVRQVEADLEKARDDLSKTTLRSPIEGVVTRLNAKVGEQVIIGTMNNPGTVIMTLSDMRDVLTEVGVDETDVTQLKAAQHAEIRVDAVQDHVYEGLVESIGNAADREGTVSRFPVKIQFTSPDERLRPGMSAHASVQVDERTDLLAIPLQAVVRRTLKDYEDKGVGSAREKGGVEAASKQEATPTDGDDGDVDPDRELIQVVLVERDGKAKMVKVELGISDAFRVEVLSGLEEGDKVILGPYRKLRSLKNGELVRRVEKDEAGEDNEAGS